MLRKTCRSPGTSCHGSAGPEIKGEEQTKMGEALAKSCGLIVSWFYGFRGRNPDSEVAVMYTGTVIHDLMKTAERVANQAEQQIKEELREIFAMRIPIKEDDQVYQGAA